jgi:hypothetical protein
MNPSIQSEASSPLRVQSLISQAESPTITEVNPPPLRPEASNIPEIVPTPSQTEASALPRVPQAPLLQVAQEIPSETEQNPAPVQEVRHEVNRFT